MTEERKELIRLTARLDEFQTQINKIQTKRDALASRIETLRYEIELQGIVDAFKPMAIGSIELTEIGQSSKEVI